jgi:hypothetical protein
MQPPTLSITMTEHSATSRRRRGRVFVCGVETSLGEALDVSAGGMRVRCRGSVPREGALMALDVATLDGRFVVGARVAWVKRIKGAGSNVGLEFVKLTPEIQAQIRFMAMANRSERHPKR